MSGIKPPGTLILSETTIDDLTLWLEAFDDYVTLTQSENISYERKRTLLLAVGGLELRKIINGLTLADDKYETLISGLKHYLQPIVNVLIERHRFFELKRNVDEELSAFLVRLRRSANLCEFNVEKIDTIVNQLVRDHFIRGINNKKLTEEILSKGTLNLNDTVKAAEGRLQAIADTEFLSAPNNQILSFNDRNVELKSEMQSLP